jgi:hypothetical protein
MVVELARSLLSASGLPTRIWAQARENAVYVLYCTGKISVFGKSPMEMWSGHMMKNLDHLCVFGTECFVYTPKQFRKKFNNKSVFGRIIGYMNGKDVYQVYVPSLKKIVHLHDIYFKPERVYTSSVVEMGLKNAAVEDVVEKRQEGDTMLESSQPDKTLEVETKEDFSRKTERPIRTVKWPMWMTSGEYILLSAHTAIAGGGGDPISYWEAMKSTQKEEWVRAMKEEMDALMKNNMWELVVCPKNVMVINNCWVL